MYRQELYDLIHSLNKGEKRYFKEFYKNGPKSLSQKWIKWFNFLESQKNYSFQTEKALVKKLQLSSSLSANRSFLRDKILEAIEASRAYEQRRKPTPAEHIRRAEIFSEKGLKKSLLKELKRSEKKLRKAEDWLALAQQKEFEIRKLYHLNLIGWDEVTVRHQELQKIYRILENLSAFKELQFQIHIAGTHKTGETFDEHPLLLSNQKALSKEAMLQHYNLRHVLAFNIAQWDDRYKALREFDEFTATDEAFDHWLPPRNRLTLKRELAITAFRTGRFKEGEQHTETLKNWFDITGEFYNFFTYFYCKVFSFCFSPQLQTWQKVNQQFLKEQVNLQKALPSYFPLFHYHRAIVFWRTGDLATAQDLLLNDLYINKNIEEAQALAANASLLLLLVETNQLKFLASILPPLKSKLMRELNDLTELEKQIFEFCERYLVSDLSQRKTLIKKAASRSCHFEGFEILCLKDWATHLVKRRPLEIATFCKNSVKANRAQTHPA